MSKTKVVIIIVACILGSLLVDAMFGSVLSAKLSTIRLFNRFQLVKPGAPIVINKKEEVRASDTEDIINAVDKAKSKVSLVIYKLDNSVKVAGGAINVTSDGFFLTTKAALASAGTNKIFVLSNDGKVFPVSAGFSDPATNLVMLKTDATGVAVADFGKAEELNAGQRVAFLSASSAPYASRFTASFVSFPVSDTAGQTFESDRPTQSFGVQGVTGIFPGQALINLAGEVVGIFDGVTVIPSTTLKTATSLFVEKKANLIRPTYGFRYRILGQVEAGILGLPQGAQLVKVSNAQPAVVSNSAAATTGLLDGDVITSVGDTKVDATNTLETLLQKHKPGEAIILNVFRSGSPLSLTIKPGAF